MRGSNPRRFHPPSRPPSSIRGPTRWICIYIYLYLYFAILMHICMYTVSRINYWKIVEGYATFGWIFRGTPAILQFLCFVFNGTFPIFSCLWFTALTFSLGPFCFLSLHFSASATAIATFYFLHGILSFISSQFIHPSVNPYIFYPLSILSDSILLYSIFIICFLLLLIILHALSNK